MGAYRDILLQALAAIGIVAGLTQIYRNVKGSQSTVNIFTDATVTVREQEIPADKVDIEIIGSTATTEDEELDEEIA